MSDSEREKGAPRGFSEETNATPLIRLADAATIGPKRPCLVMVAGPRLGEIFPIEGELLIGREPDAQLRLSDDESVSRRHARVKAVGGADSTDGALLTDLGSANGTWVDGERVNEAVLKEGAKIRIGQTVVLKYARYDQLEEQAQRQLLEAALRDGLTHAFNRRYFAQRLEAELRFAERHGQTLALLFLDVDQFKALNDQHGHLAGDDVLRRLVELLTQALRAEDVVARYGGEEFAVLVRGVKQDHAVALAERLRKTIEAAPFGSADKPLRVTVSIGVAISPQLPAPASPPADAATDLIERADAAVLRAKSAGRNRVES